MNRFASFGPAIYLEQDKADALVRILRRVQGGAGEEPRVRNRAKAMSLLLFIETRLQTERSDHRTVNRLARVAREARYAVLSSEARLETALRSVGLAPGRDDRGLALLGHAEIDLVTALLDDIDNGFADHPDVRPMAGTLLHFIDDRRSGRLHSTSLQNVASRKRPVDWLRRVGTAGHAVFPAMSFDRRETQVIRSYLQALHAGTDDADTRVRAGALGVLIGMALRDTQGAAPFQPGADDREAKLRVLEEMNLPASFRADGHLVLLGKAEITAFARVMDDYGRGRTVEVRQYAEPLLSFVDRRLIGDLDIGGVRIAPVALRDRPWVKPAERGELRTRSAGHGAARPEAPAYVAAPAFPGRPGRRAAEYARVTGPAAGAAL